MQPLQPHGPMQPTQPHGPMQAHEAMQAHGPMRPMQAHRPMQPMHLMSPCKLMGPCSPCKLMSPCSPCSPCVLINHCKLMERPLDSKGSIGMSSMITCCPTTKAHTIICRRGATVGAPECINCMQDTPTVHHVPMVEKGEKRSHSPS
mmetsp:Transcript_37002/g.82257  ORF Transcript_37002/g.82257 Transcript_37002/m.82257 type:complete len:147 (-) Transcript_37002:54-494(-)